MSVRAQKLPTQPRPATPGRGLRAVRRAGGSTVTFLLLIIAAVFVLAGFAAAAVLVIAHKATAGIDGQSVRYRRIILATWGTGYLILLLAQATISGSVSTRALAFVALAGPLLLAGLVYILASALGRNRPALALGAWLVIAAVSCAWQAPAEILATCALAGGGGFLLIAAIETRLRT